MPRYNWELLEYIPFILIYSKMPGTVQPAKRLYPSRLRTWNFASHVTFLRGFCVGFARNLILFLFEREREGYKRFADCTVTHRTQYMLPPMSVFTQDRRTKEFRFNRKNIIYTINLGKSRLQIFLPKGKLASGSLKTVKQPI